MPRASTAAKRKGVEIEPLATESPSASKVTRSATKAASAKKPTKAEAAKAARAAKAAAKAAAEEAAAAAAKAIEDAEADEADPETDESEVPEVPETPAEPNGADADAADPAADHDTLARATSFKGGYQASLMLRPDISFTLKAEFNYKDPLLRRINAYIDGLNESEQDKLCFEHLCTDVRRVQDDYDSRISMYDKDIAIFVNAEVLENGDVKITTELDLGNQYFLPYDDHTILEDGEYNIPIAGIFVLPGTYLKTDPLLYRILSFAKDFELCSNYVITDIVHLSSDEDVMLKCNDEDGDNKVCLIGFRQEGINKVVRIEVGDEMAPEWFN